MTILGLHLFYHFYFFVEKSAWIPAWKSWQKVGLVYYQENFTITSEFPYIPGNEVKGSAFLFPTI